MKGRQLITGGDIVTAIAEADRAQMTRHLLSLTMSGIRCIFYTVSLSLLCPVIKHVVETTVRSWVRLASDCYVSTGLALEAKMLRLLCPLCVVSFIFMRGPTENGPTVISKPDWIDREKVIGVIRDKALTKEQRIEKIKAMPIHENEENTKIWLANLPKVIEYFDWAEAEKAKATPKAREAIAKAEKKFGVDFMMFDDQEQSRALLRFFADIEKDVDDMVRNEIVTLAERCTEKLEQLGVESTVARSILLP